MEGRVKFLVLAALAVSAANGLVDVTQALAS